MDKFIINGGIPLHGEVTPGGNKNAALPLLSACLLSEEPVTLRNVPDIKDVQIMGELIQSLGVEIKKLEATTWQIHAKEIHPTDLDPDLCRKIRASILLAGPVVAKTGNLQLSPPRRRCHR